MGFLYLRKISWWEKQLLYEYKYFFVLLVLLGLSFLGQNFSKLDFVYVCIFGVVGMVMESLCSVYWKYFFKNRFYFYTIDTWFKGYTSWLNVIPWALGARLYLLLADILSKHGLVSNNLGSVSFVMLANSIVAGVFLVLFYRWMIGRDFKMNINKLALVLSPILIATIVTASVLDTGVLWLVVCFGVIGSLAEYIYGKLVQLLLGKKLWMYQYFTLDKGHFSLVNPLGFSILGFGFLLVDFLMKRIF